MSCSSFKNLIWYELTTPKENKSCFNLKEKKTFQNSTIWLDVRRFQFVVGSGSVALEFVVYFTFHNDVRFLI